MGRASRLKMVSKAEGPKAVPMARDQYFELLFLNGEERRIMGQLEAVIARKLALLQAAGLDPRTNYNMDEATLTATPQQGQ
jgi:hypothetical protein